MVLDPTYEEELIHSGIMRIVMNSQFEICLLSKPGGVPLLPEQIFRSCEIAKQEIRKINELIKNQISTHLSK